MAYTVGMTTMRFGGDWLQLRLGRMGLHRLSVGLAWRLRRRVPGANEAASIVGFLLVGLGVAPSCPSSTTTPPACLEPRRRARGDDRRDACRLLDHAGRGRGARRHELVSW